MTKILSQSEMKNIEIYYIFCQNWKKYTVDKNVNQVMNASTFGLILNVLFIDYNSMPLQNKKKNVNILPLI